LKTIIEYARIHITFFVNHLLSSSSFFSSSSSSSSSSSFHFIFLKVLKQIYIKPKSNNIKKSFKENLMSKRKKVKEANIKS